MSSRIQKLPSEIIHLIAAGEIIDSLAAVVRELVENALDAQATRLVISISPHLWRVQVADNGMGMTLTDLRICASAHSTSKIFTREDLGNITSLGFRGEALHSLAQVAELEILSRTTLDQEIAGWRITYSQGQPVTEEVVPIAPGTIVTVSDLFGNMPVRRKGLPSLSQQMKMVQTFIHNAALCHPDITWQMFQDEQPWFNLSPGTTPKQILPQILKNVRLSDLQSFNVEIPTPQDQNPPSSIQNSNSKIELVVGLPDRCHRGRPDWIKVAINGRLVRSPELEQTLLTGMSGTLPRDRYPVIFLHLHTCPSQIDWNRHPAKTEIYLQSLPFWQEQITIALEQALRISPVNLPNTLQNQRVGQLLKAAESKGTYQVNPSPKPEIISEIGLISLKAVAQIRNTYIMAEHESGLWLIEQHIAHERVLYEQLQDDWALVDLESPIILANLKSNQIQQLEGLGLKIEPFGEQMWAVRSTPKMLSHREDCAEALLELSLGGNLQAAQVATACRSAIRNGTSLSLSEMQTILDQWKKTRHPRTCPHGRPIYLPLEESALARFFRRHWVIGKSHGI